MTVKLVIEVNRISVFVRRQRIKKLETWITRAILAEAFFLAIFPSVAAMAIFVGIIAWFLRLQIDGRFKMRSLPFDVPVTIFIMLGAVSVFMSPATSFTLIYNYCGLVGIFGLTYLLVGQNIRTPEQVRLLVKAFAASALIVVLVGLFQYTFGIDVADMKWANGEAFPELRKRIFSTMESPNVLAGYLDVIICLALGLLAKIDDRKRKLLIGAAILILTICLTLTYSRGAFLAIAVVFLIYGVLQDWRALVLFAAFVGFLLYRDAALLDRILSLFTVSTDSADGLRMGIWVSTIAMIADHPFIGIGWGAYKFIYPQYNYYFADPSVIIYHAHNLYLNVAAEVGIAGALAYFWYFFGTMFMALALSSNRRYAKIKSTAFETARLAFESKLRRKLLEAAMSSKPLQALIQSKAVMMARMADWSDKLMDWLSFTPSESEIRKSGKKDKDITAADLEGTKKKSARKSKPAPELVHHEEMKWNGKSPADKKPAKKSKNKSDDDKMDLQKFAAPVEDFEDDDDEDEKLSPKMQIVEGVRLGIGLAFLSMALNGMSDDLLFNIPSSMLMWLLGALGAAINLLDED